MLNSHLHQIKIIEDEKHPCFGARGLFATASIPKGRMVRCSLHCCPSCVIVTRPFRYAPTSVCTSSRGAALPLPSLSQTPNPTLCPQGQQQSLHIRSPTRTRPRQERRQGDSHNQSRSGFVCLRSMLELFAASTKCNLFLRIRRRLNWTWIPESAA